MHLRQKCKKYIELNRFYGRVYLTSLQQFFSKTLEKELILFVLENDSRILKDLDIILALTPNELFIQKNYANKIFEKIAEIYLVHDQEQKQPSKQNSSNDRTIKEALLRIKSQYEKDQVCPQTKLQLKQNHLELTQESEDCIILEQSRLIIDNNNDYQQYSMMDMAGQDQNQNNNQSEQFYQSDENSSRHNNIDIVEINDDKYYS